MGQLSSYTNTFVSGTNAKADEVNQNFTDIKNAHNATDTASLYKDGSKAMTGNLAMGSNKITGLANGSSSGDAVNKSQLDAAAASIANAVLKDGSEDFTKAQSYAKHTITGASNATPIVITSTAHGRTNGETVLIDEVEGNTAANGTWVVANKTDNTYELTGSVGNGTYSANTGVGYLLPQSKENLIPKAYLDDTIATQSKIVPFGTVTTGTKTMTVNRVHTANFTGASTLAVPTITTTDQYAYCYLKFTTSNASYPTFPTVKWDWDYTPTFSTTKHNKVLFETFDNGTIWEASYKQRGT